MPSTKQRDTVTPEAFLANYLPEVQAIASTLRELVKATVPEVQERVALGWQLIGYRVPHGSRSRYFCFVAPLAHEVRLGFEYGVLLSDQAQLEGGGSQVRYVPSARSTRSSRRGSARPSPRRRWSLSHAEPVEPLQIVS